MTEARLKELNEMAGKLRKIVELQRQAVGFLIGPESERKAVIFLIGGGNYNPRAETWKKIWGLLAEDLEQRRAEYKVEFEFAS